MNSARDEAEMEVPLAQRQHNARVMTMDGTEERHGDERMDEAGGGRDQPVSSPAFQPPWYTPGFWNSPVRVVSSDSHSSSSRRGNRDEDDMDIDDCREQHEDIRERDEDEGDTVFDRIHEPLKRFTAATNNIGQQDNDQQNDKEGQENPSKRRLVIPSTTVENAINTNRQNNVQQVFFDSVPPLSERALAFVEYTAPSAFCPMFFFMGYSRFAITWVSTMYICHAMQCLITKWGKAKDGLTVSGIAWLPPLYHSLIDTYVWNHSMITCMLLKPEWFDLGVAFSAYALACFFTMGQQQLYLLVSLRTHYELNKDKLVPQKCPNIERHLMDTFVMYGIADVAFVLSKLLHQPWVLHIGLFYFNWMPLYLVLAHKQRMDEALRLPQKGNKKSMDQKKEK